MCVDISVFLSALEELGSEEPDAAGREPRGKFSEQNQDRHAGPPYIQGALIQFNSEARVSMRCSRPHRTLAGEGDSSR